MKPTAFFVPTLALFQAIWVAADIQAAGGISWSTATARFLNNTVVGFARGILVGRNVTATFENKLLDNSHDTTGVPLGLIASTLLSDGQFAGQNDDITDNPILRPNGKLLPGSAGVDAGNNLAAGLPSSDITGGPRIVDGDRNGNARVDVVAFEAAPIPEPSGFFLAMVVALLGVSRSLQLPSRMWRSV